MSKIQAGMAIKLEVEREAEFGYFIGDGMDSILLPNSEIQADSQLSIGDKVKVFVYLDKTGRLTATMKIPEVRFDSYGWAEVVSVKKEMGVFVNIGISKDILVSVDDLPNLRHLWPKAGDSLYISLKTDRHERLLGNLRQKM